MSVVQSTTSVATSNIATVVKETIERSLAFLVVSTGGNLAKRLIIEIVKRFKS